MENDKIIEQVLMASIKEQRHARRWKVGFRLFWIAIIGIVLFVFTNKNNDIKSGKSVGVVNLNGAISSENNTYETISKGLQDAFKDKNTIAVILRANSPGGSPVYSDMLYNEIIRLKKKYPNKPINVVTEEVCASGCYYIASAANKIYASPASIVGSIGVIYTGFGLTNMMQKIGVDSRLLISGKNKAMGYPFITSDKTQTLMQQEMLDIVHNQFIKAVKDARGAKLKSSNLDLFSGRYWVGEQALTLGLIDGYYTVDTLSKIEYKTTNIVDFTPENSSMDKIAKKFGVTMFKSIKHSVVSDWVGIVE